MLQFDNWQLSKTGNLAVHQYDNHTRSLEVVGTIPDGWIWDMLVQVGKHMDIIRLTQGENGLSVILTADMLALSGYYTLQLRGTRGEQVRHTNTVQLYVGDSLSGDAQWPEVPSEFSQMEKEIRAMYDHPPLPGDEGVWMVWDMETEQYIQSQLPLPAVSEGPQGEPGPQGETGPQDRKRVV